MPISANRMKIGEFLLRRLEEAGVGHLFGVPGDYNMVLMRLLEQRGTPHWIGTCNELNGAYAADGYARLNGLSVLVVTSGVGALSAFNGIAGAYSEHVPVIVIAGSLPQKFVKRGAKLHHTLCDEGQGQFYRAYSEITAAQTQLTHANAASEIDRMILTAWREKRPVYMELPSDVCYLDIEVPDEPLRLTYPASDPERLDSCSTAILERLQAAESPAVLVDMDAQRYGVLDEIAKLAEHWQMRVATTGPAKGAFPETSPLHVGLYGGAGSLPETLEAIEGSDCLLAIGYRRIESTTGFFSDKLPASTIHLNGEWVDIDEDNYQGVGLLELLPRLLSGPASPKRDYPPLLIPEPVVDVVGSEPVTQQTYWPALRDLVRPGDVIVVEDGTNVGGAILGLRVPEDCIYICAAQVWGSIGYTTGALLGTLAAAPDRRHILLTGDGSFQMTAQELSTVLRHGYKPLIFLTNNGGYTIERTILGKDDSYNDIANWRYAELPHVFAPEAAVETAVVHTNDELRSVLDAPHDEFLFVEVVMDKDDAPELLILSGHELAETVYGPRGPQHEPGAQIPTHASVAMGAF
jgi:indolepyruvate decarboxylase